jgi:MutS-like protein
MPDGEKPVDAATEAVVADYRARAAAYAASARAASRIERRLGVARLACFAVGTLAAIALAESQLGTALGVAIIAAAGVCLFCLVGWHASVRERVRTLRALERGCAAGSARATRDWSAMPSAVDVEVPPDHAFAGDLHIAGAHSLARLLPPVSRVAGRHALSQWLVAELPPDVDTVRSRQGGVRELIPRAEWRERLSVLGERLVAEASSVEAFYDWAEGEPRAASTRRLRALGTVLGAVTVAAFVAAVSGLVPAAVPLILIVVNLVIAMAARRAVDGALKAVAGHETRLRGVGDVLGHALSEPLTADASAALAERLGRGEAVRAFGWFDRIAKLAEVRLSPMGHYALQAFVLWDLHVVDSLERWRARHGRYARSWLSALGELEALSAFATLAHENPNWCFPLVENHAAALDATELAHPLLPPALRVGNDVTLAGAGDILFVTGSNMSGKSTLLRAIGLNVVLAQAGAPVCARTMRVARTRLRTSIEATDALERGLSLFMAELLRIKAIVDAARMPADCPLLFIADEMLRGTNARDRHTAVISILGQLVAAGASGVVATHDPDLAGDERLRPHIRPFHLLEQFRADGAATSMWFDYRLRPGLATTRNAIQLLELVGLGGPAADESATTGRSSRNANN